MPLSILHGGVSGRSGLFFHLNKTFSMEELRITTVQSILHWEQADKNLDMFSSKLAGLKGTTDLVVLPEMFTTGFSMQAESLAESMDGPSVRWMEKTAAELNAVVTGSLIIEERGQFFNRLVWMRPDGSRATYDKRHLFTLAGEHEQYAAGKRHLIVSCRGWSICPLICYDLRFPVWSRNVSGFDVLLYMANWPEKRSQAWKTLLAARAIENQCYTVGVNRVGEDANGHTYSGDTSLYNFAGDLLHQSSFVEEISTIRISKEEQEVFRTELPFLKDADDFVIKVG
jgi:omega-amidase